MEIVHFPHPTLRFKSAPIKRVDPQLRDIVREMFDLMYESKGVGLAANQVDLPIRLFVVNLAADPEEGEEMVFINPVISRGKGSVEQEEGCLSLPGVYGSVRRPKEIDINAFGMNGKEISARVDGMLARVIQHENDHLDGIMFTDRLSETGQIGVRDLLDEFATDFESRRSTGEIPADSEIEQQREQWLERYCQ